MKDISVRFPGVLALDHAHIDVRAGEVHVLLGENGAGKSTIMKVLAGVNTEYDGEVSLRGEKIECRSVEEQRERGVSIIFQEMNLLPNLTVAENIFMGRQPTRKTGGVDWKEMYSRARQLLDSINSKIPAHAKVADLSVGSMQMVEIAKALSFNADVIIMDEPTSALSENEVSSLFGVIRDLKARNKAIVYISHRLEEILEIGDRVTVFRDGKYVTTVPVAGLTRDRMVKLMVGRDVTDYYPKVEVVPGDVALEVRGLSRGDVVRDASFVARSGEITGFYGLLGAGRTELMRCVFGADPHDSGEVLIKGRKAHIRSCRDGKNAGLAFLTEDRKNQGLILNFDVAQNISLANLGTIMGTYGLSRSKEQKNAQRLVDSIRVKTPSLRQKVRNLSGGNQQKVVVCKWLNATTDIVIFDEPTRGIDVGAKVEIYQIMNRLKQEGKAIIVVSSELTECLGISDRMYIMHEGAISGCIESDRMDSVTEELVVSYATGSNEASEEERD